jgi:hypothetical protein
VKKLPTWLLWFHFVNQEDRLHQAQLFSLTVRKKKDAVALQKIL